MKSLHTIIFLLILSIALPAAATTKRQEITGTVMAAETNKPVAGAGIAIFGRTEKGITAKPVATTVSNREGTFTARLPKGKYTWFIKAEGLGPQRSGITVSTTPVELGKIYLRKPADLSGRIVDGSGAAVAGVTIKADEFTTAISGADGRFRFAGLDPHGYEPALIRAGWVLEKGEYYYLSPGEQKDMGNVVIRRAASLKVRLKPQDNGIPVSIDKVRINLSGNTVYRSIKSDSKGLISFADLPPGRYTVSAPDERLKHLRQELEITEGQTAEVTIDAELKPPTLTIEEYSEVFLPERPLKLRARSLRVDKSEAILWRIETGALLSGTADLRKADAIPDNLLSGVTAVPVLFKARKESHTRGGLIQLPGLQPGAYLLELKGNGARTRFAFLVTRLGLVAKSSPDGVLLFATDLIDGTPLEGVVISGLPGGGTLKTGRDGLNGWSGTGKAGRLMARSGNNLAFLDLPGREAGEGVAAHKGYIYTDRPAYRPGQTVFFKGVLRQRAGEGYNLPQVKEVQVTVKDDNDKTVCESTAVLSAVGSFNGQCILPAVPALGEYSIVAARNGETWQGSFKVLEYRKPEFEVKAAADRRFLVAGDSGQMTVTARYYFGAPVAGGKLVWRLYSKPAWGLMGEEDDSYGDDDRRFGGYADFIGEGELKLSDSGEAVIPVAAKSHDMPMTYTLEVDVTDASARQVSASGSVTVVPSLVALSVRGENYLARPGVPQTVSIKAATWEGAPRTLPVKLTFSRQVYDRKSRSYSWQEEESASLTTEADGNARSTFTFPSPGYWQITARAADDAGRPAVATTSVWVWKEGYSWEGSYRELETEFDRKQYLPGDTARLIIRAPKTGGSLLLTLEGRDITEQRMIKLNGMVEVVEIPVTEALAPYIHVTAQTVADGRFFNRTLPLKVDFQPDRLDVKISSDKAVYAPGDTVRLSVRSGSGTVPLPAELSVGVVDEGIYAIARERSDDIWQFFRGTRDHLVTTLNSFPRVYLGGAAKDKSLAQEADDGLKGLKVRKVFKDTAAWYPLLETGADGTATATFTLPDNLTTWRATAIGHTPTNRFGSGREKFIARLELMARLAPPRFMTVGDQLQIPGVITSMSDSPQQASGRFEVSGLTLLDDATFAGDIVPRGTLRRNATLRADAPGTATLRLLARGNDKGDAMELPLPVLPRSIVREAAAGIALRETEGATAVTLPDEALKGSADLQISFAPTIAASLNGAITRLVEFPYGCVEQTLSRFIPAVHARSLLSLGGWRPDPATEAKLPLTIATGIRRLEEMQHEDGGWGWWKNDGTSITMTAHAIYGLGLAKRAGMDIPESLLKRGISTLEKQITTAMTDDLPRAYRALAVNGVRNEGVEARIEKGWKSLPLADRLSYGEALALSGSRDKLIPLIEELKREVLYEGQTAYLKDKAAESWWYGWQWGSSTIETTAAMLSLLIKQEPHDPLNAQLAGFLARRQEGGWWRTTVASSAAVVALADYVAASGEAEASYTARLSLNGAELATWRVVRGQITAGAAHLTVPAGKLASGINRLHLAKDGPGASYLAATMEYRVLPEAAHSSTVMNLDRTYYRISSVKGTAGWRREYTPLKPDDIIKPGDDIEVRLTVDNKRDLEYVIIEDRLPAGFESRETDRDPRFMDEAAYFGWFSHRERRDEKLAFFITTLPAGRHEFRHVLYPELVGVASALPAAVWPMYQPEMRGESSPWKMEIKSP